MDQETFEEQAVQTKGLNGHDKSHDHELNIDPDATFELTDEMDHEILMHRDAHFGGDFGVMLNYYEQDGFGVNPDFDIERIAYLASIEQQLETNLAAVVLDGSEAERVAKARAAYSKLKEVYEGEGNDLERLVADILL
nr:hypothetical protein [Chlamydiota bacterium]